LLSAKLASQGQRQSAQIAALCGRGTSRVFDWLKMLREDGVEGLLQRDKPGPCAGDFKLLNGKHGLEVKNQHGAQLAKKIGGVLRVPRPRHPKRGSDVEMAHFKESPGRGLRLCNCREAPK